VSFFSNLKPSTSQASWATAKSLIIQTRRLLLPFVVAFWEQPHFKQRSDCCRFCCPFPLYEPPYVLSAHGARFIFILTAAAI